MSSTVYSNRACFITLPQECQDMIWEFALPEGRDLAIYFLEVDNLQVISQEESIYEKHGIQAKLEPREDGRTPVSYQMIVNTKPIPTSLLHACLRSRSIALKHYRIAPRGNFAAPIYVDWSKDAVLIEGQNPVLLRLRQTHRATLGALHKPEFKDWVDNIQRLNVSFRSTWGHRRRGFLNLGKSLIMLQKLKEVIIRNARCRTDAWTENFMPNSWTKELGDEEVRFTRSSLEEKPQ